MAGRLKAFSQVGFPDPHGSSQSPVTLVPGDLPPSSGLSGHYMYVIHIHANTQTQNQSIFKNQRRPDGKNA